ncbi:M28 family metallopeptidase [Caulobacter vibrioides]|uniref:M28 family metallopeptidase n=1 Tax=Caulobacter vibrioides TaxID=155892 RepID=UPI000C77104F|nr:M28 family metallopeptidase [Caulobacter vibrioides]AVG21569.1 peptidase M20 [Caulobacter vibrioides]PLR10934.1 peptidase M20 [Caulobacter vibrioides]
MKTIRFLGFWICLALGLALGALSQQPPPPVGVTAPATAFSADRAMADVAAIAQKPHPTGSAEIARVRDHLLSRINALRLEVSVRPGEGFSQHDSDGRTLSAAAVQNLVGVLPGRDRSLPAILVMSHYDSVHNSPGAADDASGTAAALEIARALKASGPHARDVIFLFTDAEEAGLLGADAFFARDPSLARVGLVVNMEARGDAGRAAMFQTGPGNGALIGVFGREAKGASGNSMASTVYEKMPNDTDFTHAVNKGLPGLNLAFIDNQLAYHTPLSRPDHLQRGSLQHMGDQVLPTVRALANASELPARTENAIYSDVLGLFMIRYPPAVGWALLALAAALVGFCAWRALAGRGASGWEIARGAAGLLLTAASAGLVLHLLGRLLMIDGVQRYYGLLTRFDFLLWGAGLLAAAAGLGVATAQARGARRVIPCVVALVLGGACSLVGGFDPIGLGLGLAACVLAALALGFRTEVLGAWIGGMIVVLLLAIAAQVLAPGATVMLTWPLLVAAVGAALVIGIGGTRDKRVALALTTVVGLLAILSTAQLAAWGAWTFAGVGLMEPAVLAVFAMLAAPALSPLAHDFAATRWAWRAAGIMALVGVALTANAARLGGEPSRPAITQALHVADLSTGKAWRVAGLTRLDAWTRAVLPDDGGSEPRQQALAPFWKNPVWMSETRVVPVASPQLTVDRAEDRLLIRLIPAPGAELVSLRLRPSTPLSQPRLNGRPITLATQAGEWSSLTYHAPDPNGITLSFTTAGPGQVEVAALEHRDGWPTLAKAPPPKPADLMAFGMSDKTAVLVRGGLSW